LLITETRRAEKMMDRKELTTETDLQIYKDEKRNPPAVPATKVLVRTQLVIGERS
jgi:hypothetical protein